MRQGAWMPESERMAAACLPPESPPPPEVHPPAAPEALLASEELRIAAPQRPLGACSDGWRIPSDPDQWTVLDLVRSYLLWAKGMYRRASDGAPTRTPDNIRHALTPLAEQYGDRPMREIGRPMLADLRDRDKRKGLAVSTIGDRIKWQRALVRWAVEREHLDEMVEVKVMHLRTPRKGDSGVSPGRNTKPARWEDVEPVIRHLHREGRIQLAAMIRLHWLSGMRPCEVCAMRRSCIDMAPEDPDHAGLWIYRPLHNKSERFGKVRLIPLGPQAQEVLRGVMGFEDVLFEGMRNMRPTGKAITTHGYSCSVRRAIRRCAKHGRPVRYWRVGQLRHSFSTRVRAQWTLNEAREVLGHSSLKTTEIYAEPSLRHAAEVALKIG